ncbi:T9SS C-terminal target domain-containing protein [Chryseobacterium phosphatilyticum]|uniref:T9SS C-terminal target domain-containing protein n=1 Tax=Chryseobacterium phosphatilyticum TaxID=475075 RepID=A0A316XCJ5_9FLAO|nr:GEVED domain-containing protein [Chryseobacterium phosphatilyticum]PWN69943.1 T9SS C-terminal target domain-containing protein [Chryseobacterium phosphatilyticum]
MKKIFTSLFFFCLFVIVQAQWTSTTFERKGFKNGSQTTSYYSLDISLLKAQLEKAPEMGRNAKPVTISLPTLGGKIERFAVYSFPVVVKELADQYQLGSYVGAGVDDPSKYVRFSLAPNDFQSMIFTKDGSEFIEPANTNKTIYEVHPKTEGGKAGFVCSTEESTHDKHEIKKLYQQGQSFQNQPTDFARSSDRKYRTLRLAMSVTGEYTQFHGGTVAGALTAINATLTRVNGVFEKDFALHLNLQNFPNVIYTNPATDPYSGPAAGMGGNPFSNPDGWSLQLKNTLETNVGLANYDIGHLFGASGGGGMAGCVGCVCEDVAVPNQSNGKGSGYTSPSNGVPQGDTFDIDFVAHEMGHQLGGYHTFTYQNQGNQAQMEPGSGSTIMAYAGVADAQGVTPPAGTSFNLQQNSDAYFFKKSIDDIQVVLSQKVCDVETPVANNPPVIGPLPTYTIPKGTAFVLTASVTDAENDPMTYAWEEVDLMTGQINAVNLGTTTEGPSFRSLMPTTSPTRYFPRLSSVLAGVLNNSNNLWEAVSTVARTSKFAITVRDNNPVANQQQTQTAVQTITVGNNGPFKVNPTTVYNNGPTTVTWDVVNTNTAPYNAANVKIDFTTDNGVTWNVVSASTPNDGTESLDFSSFPLTVGGTAKIRVSAINNVFYAIGTAPIETLPVCTSNPPGGVQVTTTTQTTATITWNASYNATYVVQYRVAGTTAWTTVTPAPTTNTVTLTGLTAGTHYEVQIANVCAGVTGSFSAITIFMTPYCAATSSNANNGYISNVTVAATNSYTMSNNSGANNYTDYSADTAKLITLVRGTTTNNISVAKSWPASTSSKAISVWIDFDKNGTFDTSERILNGSNNTTTPVTGTFVVPATAYAGPLTTRMRVLMRNTNNPSPCGNFTDGEVEDYAVKIIDMPQCTSAAPSNITITNLTPTSANVSWAATTGATYVLRWRKVGTTVWTTIDPVPAPINNYTISGLEEQTKYEVQVATKCNGAAQGAFSPLQQFTTPALSYCSMTGTGTNDHISNVTVTSVNPALPVMTNNSVQTNYISYTTPATLITLEIGSVNNKISVGKGWTGATGNTAVAAWIDFNRDGQFDNSERIINSTASTTTPVSGLFGVPANAYSGPLTTTMRVVLQRTSSPTMCQNAINGEVEDYVVRLKPCSTDTPTGLSFNTITHNSAIVNWTGATNNLTYLLQYRVIGAATWTEIYVTNVPHTLNNLLPSTTYEVQVAANCGITAGTFTAIKTFTTRCDPTPPGITVSSITTNSALITWNPSVVGVAYTMRWRKVGTVGWPNPDIPLPAAPVNTYTLGGLDPYTTYEVQIANKCAGETTWNPYSNPAVFTTERTCELPPPGLTITQLLPTSAEVKWDPFPGATYILRYRKVGIPSWTNISVNTNTHILTGLAELTKYEMQVANICNGTPGTFTPPYYFTTPTVIYCKMASGSSTGEHIAKVTVKPNGKPMMENASGASTYTDYTGVPKTFIELIQGSTDNEIIIEKKWTGNTYNEGIAVWIDFNRNGEFDINERVFTSPPNTTSPVSGKFNVPVDAFVSMTDYKYVVMRIAMQRDGVPVNCLNFKNGEVEDYSVRISRKGIPSPIDQTGILIYPNPVSSILYVKNISKKAKYKIYNAVGQIIADGILLNNQINVSKLINGVYVLDVDDNGNTAQKKFIKE